MEIGKRGIWSPARVAQERPDVAYGFVAVDFLPPGVLHAGMACMLAAGEVAPLRTTTYGMSSTAAAMRSLAQVLLAFVTRTGHRGFASARGKCVFAVLVMQLAVL